MSNLHALRTYAQSMSPLPGMPVGTPPRRGTCASCGGGTYKGRSLCGRCDKSRALRNPRVCVQCAETYVPGSSSQRFCSRSCAQRAARVGRERKERPAYVPRAQLTPEELTEVRARSREKWKGTCSRCGEKMHVGKRSLPPDKRICQECRRKEPKRTALAPRVCDLCQESYVPKSRSRPGTQQRFCSKSCTRAWQNGARPPYKRQVVTGMARKVALARERRLRHAQTWDGITDEEILERDGWRCRIPGCKRRPIRKDLKYPHPRSKSIDHIVPLSLGGDDTAVNKRAAHLGCNIARAANAGDEQLALVGSLREPPLTPEIRGERAQPKPPRLCECGQEAAPGKRRCAACRAAAEEHRARRLAKAELMSLPRKCSECGSEFTGAPRMKVCSGECARERKRRIDRERRWIDPDYRARAIAATGRWHDRRRMAGDERVLREEDPTGFANDPGRWNYEALKLLDDPAELRRAARTWRTSRE